MKVLITGGAGNIGSAMAKYLCDKGFDVVVADDLSTGNVDHISNLSLRKFYEIDVNDLESLKKLFTQNDFDYVFHYAAVVGVERTLNNPLKVFEDINGIKNILTLSKEHNVKRVLYASSSEVYGEPFEIPQNEMTTPLNSKLPYAIVKNLGEAYCRAFQKEFGLNYTLFRFFNTYGPHQSADFVVPRFVKKALMGESIEINGDGLQTRTFCHINDNVEACFRALNSEDCLNTVLNVGNGHEITILDLAKKIIKLSGSSSDIVHKPALEEGDMTRRKPDNTKMLNLLERDLKSLDDGIMELIKLYNNE